MNTVKRAAAMGCKRQYGSTGLCLRETRERKKE